MPLLNVYTEIIHTKNSKIRCGLSRYRHSTNFSQSQTTLTQLICVDILIWCALSTMLVRDVIASNSIIELMQAGNYPLASSKCTFAPVQDYCERTAPA